MPDPAVPQRVLVALGGNQMDDESMRTACRLAKTYSALIYVVHIVEVSRSMPLHAVQQSEVERGESVLTRAEQYAAGEEVKVDAELVQARDTGPAVTDEALEWNADLILMGMPYKRRFGEFNLGKTVPYVLKHARCRVMLLREANAG